MNMRIGTSFTAVALLSLLFFNLFSAESQVRTWQTGKLISVAISGNGPIPVNKGKQSAIWWTYCICGEDRTYYAVLRKSPAKAGLTINSPVSFSADRDQLYVLNSKRERLTLKILRQDKGKGCR